MLELLAGWNPHAPARAAGDDAACAAGLQNRLRELHPEIGPALAAIVGRCLAPGRRDRYGSIHELANALRGLAQRPRLQLRPPPLRHDVMLAQA